MSYSISSYTEDSFTFAACHGNRKDDPDGGGDVDDDDDDDDDGKYLSKNLQNPWQLKNWPAITQKKLIPKYPENSQTIPGLKIEANPDPEIFTKSRPENPGIENLDPARAWSSVPEQIVQLQINW